MQNMQKYAKYANAIKYLEPGAREHTPHDDYSSGKNFISYVKCLTQYCDTSDDDLTDTIF